MNLIEMAREFSSEDYIASKVWPPEELEKTKRSLLQTVTDFFWDQMGSCNMEPVQKFVRLCLDSGDTIITFNWDLTIEHAVEKESDLHVWYKPSTGLLLLKPHGSIDWFRRETIPSGLSERDIQKLDDTLCVYPKFDLAEHQQLKTQAPVIVPPVFHKDFSLPFFKQTWRRIFKSVAAATNLY